jgi:hypothetical protein
MSTGDWLARVVDERMELVGKIEKLRVFMASDAFSTLSYEHQNLLLRQFACMGRYLDVLDERITLANA